MKVINLAILFSGNGSNLENVYKKMQGLVVECEFCGNLSLDKHSVNFANFKHSQTLNLVSRSKFAKNNESHTKNPSVILSATELSLRCEVEAIQKDKIIDCHDLQSKSLNDANVGDLHGSILDNKLGLCSCEQGNRTNASLTKQTTNLSDLSLKDNAHIKLNFSLAISSNESAFGITRCKHLGLECEVIDFKKNKSDFFAKIIAMLESHKIDLVILAGFMKILPPQFNEKFIAINIHPSILPLFKGANAIKESFESDMKIAGVSVHFVSDELDSGALIAQDIIYKISGESLASFEARIHVLEYEIYPKAIIKAVQILAQNKRFSRD